MPDEQINIWMKVKDQASQHMDKVKQNLSSFSESFEQNWLAITASITAGALALKKAFDLIEMGAKAQQIEESFARMAQSVNINAGQMRDAIMEASGATVNFSNVADKISALMAQGLSMDQVVGLMRQARAEAIIFGQTTEEAFQVIASAVTGGLVTTLRRSFGLQLSLNQAVEQYAAMSGLSAEKVRESAMAQALANHIMKSGEAHLNAVNLEVLTQYELIQRLKAEWTGFQESTGILFGRIFVATQGFINQLSSGMMSLLNHFLTPMIEKFDVLVGALQKFYGLLGRIPKFGEVYRDAEKAVAEFREGLILTTETIEKTAVDLGGDALEKYKLAFAKVQQENKAIGDILVEQTKNASDRQAEVIEDFSQQYKKYLEGTKDFQLQKLQEEYESYLKFVDDKSKVDAWYEGQKKKIMGETAEKTSKELSIMDELTRNTARNMQNSFSEFFFKAFTEQINSAGELVADFGRTMLRTFTDMIAKMMVMKIFASAGFPMAFQTGTPYVPSTGMYKLHRGERVVPAHENKGSAGGGEGGVTINLTQVIQAWDAQDVYRNRKAFSGAMADEIQKNTQLRAVIKQLG